MMREILARIPGSVLAWCATILAIAVVGCVTFLSFEGKDTTNLSQLITVILNFAGFGLAGVGAVAAGQAAAKSTETADKLNGGFDDRVKGLISEALNEHGNFQTSQDKDGGGDVTNGG